ncbi:hypothetical protein [Campylobacter upsaliensis]|uniref:hypothetical protein n=1 Tax=Campylobacter upsaliensis TaxID=28080 RepID=UPI002149C620|nr:hypothetical protein [Campylobacter upsaliensis]MCR2101553.1 hypothetical protein [Campylobacter upsaliensis]MCR2108934.1 hypothetical protein [Campylobacter upsaliensis]MCR2121348.1 hypothetical protein [Campylobacter upsaliensis]MCR2123228.1 hypothetical protein [Campylobacter upsaliensis]MCR2125193.1 hypothetical protein [Campylobacter upsaliensis]
MSQKERIKTEIDICKALILAFLTAIFGTFGFTLINYEKINLWQALGICAGLIFLFCVLFFLSKKMIKNLNKLEDLE